jgi:hypothetical protein
MSTFHQPALSGGRKTKMRTPGNVVDADGARSAE